MTLKRFFTPFLLAAALLIASSAPANANAPAKAVPLAEAIEQSAKDIAGKLPKGSRVAIVVFESEHDNVSDHIMEELTGVLIKRGIEVADRQNAGYILKTLNLKAAGVDISEEDAKSYGEFVAADLIIVGQLIDIGGAYRYRANAIHVERAIRTSATLLDVSGDAKARREIAAIAGQPGRAKSKFSVSENTTPRTAGTFLDRGIMFAIRGEYEKARADFSGALKLNPNLAAAYALRGRALYASVSKVFSVRENFSGVSIFATSEKATPEQVRVFDLAIADFTQAIRLAPKNARHYQERGNAYIGKNDYDRAIADYNQAIGITPNEYSIYDCRGFAYQFKGDLDKAIADFSQAIKMEPYAAGIYLSRGEAYYAKNDFDKAYVDVNRAIWLDPNYARAYVYRARIYLFKGDGNPDKALVDCNRAIQLNPKADNAAYFIRGSVYIVKQDFSKAIADLEVFSRANPNHAQAKELLNLLLQNRREQ
jgi:tetratricopeptide (TPR) repeat protein